MSEGSFVLTAPVPRVALTREEAAASLGMSVDTFERYVQPQLRMIRSAGRRPFVSLAELARWVDEAGEGTLP